jgi:hypothetical protein
MLYATKRLQKTDLYNEYKSLEDFYYKTSLKKEFNQQNFLKKYLFANANSGECLNINYNFENNYKKYIKSIEQKIYTIEELAKEEDLIPIFITFTLPSNHHPFCSINYNEKRLYNGINRNFEFENIEKSISNGYQLLNSLFRIFYKRVKDISKKLYYIKVFEMHKTFIPHLHILFYVKKDLCEKIRKKYVKIVTEFKLNQTDFALVQLDKKELKESGIKSGINRASKYLMKYITKSLKSGSDYYNARILDGWKRTNKIRIITSSNLDLSLSDYRTIYHNLNSIEKEKLSNKAKSKNKSIFYFILKNISIIKIVKYNEQSHIKQFSVNENSSIILFKYITKYQVNGAYKLSIDKLELFIDKKLVYEKEKYIKIKI